MKSAKKPRVAIVGCEDYGEKTVKRAVSELLALLGRTLAHPGERVVLKPNLLAPAKPEEAVTTHPALVRELVEQVKKGGAEAFVGDSPNLGGLRYTLRHTGIKEATRGAGGKLLSFDRPRKVPGFPFFALDAQVLNADALINVCKLKAHSQLLVTGAVKNLFGIVPGRRKPLLHLLLGSDELKFARMLLSIPKLVPLRLNIVDAVVAMEGQGPRKGKPKKLGMLLGGEDPVAVDRVLAEILSVPLEHHFVLQEASRQGLEGAEISNIEVVGLPVEAVRRSDFLLPRMVPITFSPLRVLRGNLKHAIMSRRVSCG